MKLNFSVCRVFVSLLSFMGCTILSILSWDSWFSRLGKLFVAWDVFSDFLNRKAHFSMIFSHFFVMATDMVLFIVSFLTVLADYIFEKKMFPLIKDFE